jgi:hypothetical protein
MKWGTSELIHFDRIASAWLILRFVDPDATFIYLKKNEFADDDVNLFGVPGVRLAMHDDQSTTFQRILNAHSISGAALNKLSKIIGDAVNHVIHDASPSGMSKREPLAAGALAFTEGIFLLSATDEECLERCLPLYDALHARLVAQVALEQSAHLSRDSVLTQTVSLANATRELRRRNLNFSEVAFADALKLSEPAS